MTLRPDCARILTVEQNGLHSEENVTFDHIIHQFFKFVVTTFETFTETSN